MGCNSYVTILAFLIALGIIELGLVVANFEGGQPDDYFERDYPKGNVKLLKPATILVIASAVWNGTLGIAYCILTAGPGVSVFERITPTVVIFVWALIAASLWCTSAVLYHKAHGNVECGGFKGPVNCEITIAAQAMGWVDFVLCLVLIALAVRWITKSVKSRRENGNANTKFVQMDTLVG
ncbi:hypothetical protein FRC19_004198 [Serendipita sp. 401]|nr:hypothetical protein FRC19_004198 [Serendipita sp. 401]